MREIQTLSPYSLQTYFFLYKLTFRSVHSLPLHSFLPVHQQEDPVCDQKHKEVFTLSCTMHNVQKVISEQ